MKSRTETVKNLLCAVAFMLLSEGVFAQNQDDNYYPYAEREPRRELLRSDTTLFYRAIQSSSDLYGSITDFDLPDVAIKRRGAEWDDELIYAEGVAVSYRHITALRMLGAEEERAAGLGMVEGIGGGIGGVRSWSFGHGEPLQSYSAQIRLTDRNYRAGARISGYGRLKKGWYGGFGVDLRTGRDMNVKGVFLSSATLAGRVERHFSDDRQLALTVVLPPVVRSSRSSATGESFSLTGDPLYNPSWGFQNGKVRSSRVRRQFLPLALLTWESPVGETTRMNITVNCEAGVEKFSSLGWYNARTPLPDNYRYMPSYTLDRATEEAWHRSDPRYTQIDWDAMIAQNRMAGGEAVYALEDRVERRTDMGMALRFATRMSPRLTLNYGADIRYCVSRNYKQMRDLLGADYLTDIDHYLVDDDTYSNLLQNNLRDPDRRIRTGDRFGYDYALSHRAVDIHASAVYRTGRLNTCLRVEIGDDAVRRRGYYEKELFPGEGSYGLSRNVRFRPYTLHGSVGWAFTPRYYLALSAYISARTPDVRNIFYQPLYNNRITESPALERISALELGYRQTGRILRLQASAYLNMRRDGTMTMRSFDDTSATYCDIAVAEIGILSYGVEVAAQVTPARYWEISAALAAGRSKYARDPVVTIISDNDNRPIDVGAASRMGGCDAGAVPRLTAMAGVCRFWKRGWGFRASASYVAGRHVEPSVVRRTDRVTGLCATSPEAFRAFVSQERLDDAATVDVALFKGFYFGNNRLQISLMLSNILGSQYLYGGYESGRIRRIQSGDRTVWMPHANRYTSSYPRSFYISASYRF